MSRKRKKKANNQPVVSAPVPSGISAEQWQHIMANAMVEAEEMKEQKKREAQEAEIVRWRTVMGHKEFDDDNAAVREIRTFFNAIGCMIRLCSIKRKDIRGDRASFVLLKLFLSLFFFIGKGLSALFGWMFILCGVIMPFAYNLTAVNVFYGFVIAAVGLMLLFVSGLFRMAGMEIDDMDDRSYLLGLFACVTSIVSIVIAIITI